MNKFTEVSISSKLVSYVIEEGIFSYKQYVVAVEVSRMMVYILDTNENQVYVIDIKEMNEVIERRKTIFKVKNAFKVVNSKAHNSIIIYTIVGESTKKDPNDNYTIVKDTCSTAEAIDYK